MAIATNISYNTTVTCCTQLQQIRCTNLSASFRAGRSLVVPLAQLRRQMTWPSDVTQAVVLTRPTSYLLLSLVSSSDLICSQRLDPKRQIAQILLASVGTSKVKPVQQRKWCVLY